MLKELIKLSNSLDTRGLTKEADVLDSIIRKMGEYGEGSFDSEHFNRDWPDDGDGDYSDEEEGYDRVKLWKDIDFDGPNEKFHKLLGFIGKDAFSRSYNHISNMATAEIFIPNSNILTNIESLRASKFASHPWDHLNGMSYSDLFSYFTDEELKAIFMNKILHSSDYEDMYAYRTYKEIWDKNMIPDQASYYRPPQIDWWDDY